MGIINDWRIVLSWVQGQSGVCCPVMEGNLISPWESDGLLCHAAVYVSCFCFESFLSNICWLFTCTEKLFFTLLLWCVLISLMYLPTPDIWWWLFICINNALSYSPLHWYLNGEAWDKIHQVTVQLIHCSNLLFSKAFKSNSFSKFSDTHGLSLMTCKNVFEFITLEQDLRASCTLICFPPLSWGFCY